jgi:hypothetical protein
MGAKQYIFLALLSGENKHFLACARVKANAASVHILVDEIDTGVLPFPLPWNGNLIKNLDSSFESKLHVG